MSQIVGRKGLLGWLNEFLQLDYTRIEQVASGAAHCQIMDAIFPGKVPLHKVNFDAKYEYEFVKNYKVLQEVFKEVGVARSIDVNKLVKVKPQDNLEFLQWMKKFFDDNYAHGREYPARERRAKCKLTVGAAGGTTASTTVAPAPISKKAAPSVAPSSATTSDKENDTRSTNVATSKTASVAVAAPKKAIATQPVPVKTKPTIGVPTQRKAPTKQIDSQAAQIAELENQVKMLTDREAELKTSLETILPEKEFYFEKLRYVEIVCQTYNPDSDISTADFIKKIEGILYAETHTPETLVDLIEPMIQYDAHALEQASATASSLLEFDDVDADSLDMPDLPSERTAACTKDVEISFTTASSDVAPHEELIDLSAPVSLGDFSSSAALDEDIFF